jgi:heme/copper-type cytochrome/quinol oxidase subunit 4
MTASHDNAVTTDAHGGAHGSIRTYLVVAAILVVVTTLEVFTYFLPYLAVGQPMHWLLLPVLSCMAFFKFWLVVSFYMHLHYDAPFYTRIFYIPLSVALAMTIVVMLLTATMKSRLFW